MNNRLRNYSLFIVNYSLFILLLSGCGGVERPADMPQLYPCEITVTAEGTPLAGATIGLYSAVPDFKWTIGGLTNEQGKAVVTTHGKYSGVPAGEYTVTVEKLEPEPYDAEKPPAQIKIYTLTNPEYTDKDKSPLKLTVQKKKTSESVDTGKPIKAVLRTVVF
ncbi:hypothetical protein FACS18942_07840 [Planctomycetales bacterium]|nr:hypothetical protein FACS18942_07840 [Planctomycetales bacterium]GHT38571.1 hypothetical protein FACS189427_12760 [Planctomycetales bacterium]